MKRSISLRLSAMFAAVSLVVFTLTGTGLFMLMKRQLFNELRETLDTRARIASLIVSHAPTVEKWAFVQEKLRDLSPADSRMHYYVEGPDPRFRFGTPIVGSVSGSVGPDDQLIRQPGRNYDVILTTYTVPAGGDRPEVKLVVGSDCERTQLMLRRFGIALGVLIAASTIAVAALSRAVTRFGLAPLTRLSKEAAQLSPSNRRQRLHSDELPEELHELATSFNGALERLDRAYERLESFNADVAHELRTPVSILIGQTQVALTRDRSVLQLRQTLQSNLEEFERLRVIVNDMLFLSRSDRGERATELTEVSLRAEVSRMLEFLEMPLEEAQLTVAVHGDASAWVNTSLFGRAMSNLLVNAIQHSSPGTALQVTIVPQRRLVEIAVSNPGEPIDPVAREHIFDRFYRLQEARSNSHENHGLGLSIVKAVAEMHGGTVFARSAGGVNTFGFSVAVDGGPPRPQPEPDAPRTSRAGIPLHVSM
ncbi:heavy metal sensor histidine kinase [Paraburkholderia caballeronis]|uniref:Sensor protein n=1 Tax=Paraburkholderia caballeronis TaxID=416943 RepID=A0A1H7UJX9_9BURK|nr:heavy metal sensor histidine kinase [Paraburkholderia caballeronis]PXW17475.1 heavy metal sensor signal transduction histidine kinase [Paraburkholderia caballeronis]PXW95064.1 heavy metal sensor signal transduction histidine kinase [Paraburkholderia caballeronis]RAJ90910.1 heavy metal sensor signal transduction histidine kinase [Paraburkholderia caballeronis]TDV07870.1 heavy metal sensor signal transduction histidine kinase [Paraburkholderia caballeronis]TDV11233.1 heavy metal sensor signal